jgi:hypothetical protein
MNVNIQQLLRTVFKALPQGSRVPLATCTEIFFISNAQLYKSGMVTIDCKGRSSVGTAFWKRIAGTHSDNRHAAFIQQNSYHIDGEVAYTVNKNCISINAECVNMRE